MWRFANDIRTLWTQRDPEFLKATKEAPQIIGLSESTTYYISMNYFRSHEDQFQNVLVHEAALERRHTWMVVDVGRTASYPATEEGELGSEPLLQKGKATPMSSLQEERIVISQAIAGLIDHAMLPYGIWGAIEHRSTYGRLAEAQNMDGAVGAALQRSLSLYFPAEDYGIAAADEPRNPEIENKLCDAAKQLSDAVVRTFVQKLVKVNVSLQDIDTIRAHVRCALAAYVRDRDLSLEPSL
jgi:hypothetical protein